MKEDSQPDFSSSKLDEKLNELTKKLEEINSHRHFQTPGIDEQVVQNKSLVISCLKKNKGRPLNCWEEVENFKKIVSSAWIAVITCIYYPSLLLKVI